MSRKVCFVAVFAVSALPQVCFAASSFAAVAPSSAAVSSLSKVSFVAVFVASSSAVVSSLPNVCFAVSSSAVASFAFGKNRAATLVGCRTISLSKSTSFSCKTIFLFFVSFV